MTRLRIQRVSSGDVELDRFLSGGYPRGSLVLVSGNPGTGKTTLTAKFLYDGAKNAREVGVYASFSEGKRSFYENMGSFGLDFQELEKEGRFNFLEVFPASRQGMGDIARYLLAEITRSKAKRLVIDSYSSMAQAMGGHYEGRQVLQTFFNRIMKNVGCTTLLIAEQPTGESRIGDTAEEFVSDGVLSLSLDIPRELEIRKMRGTLLKTRRLLYTMEHGFEVVTTKMQTPDVPRRWQPIRDYDHFLSTGSQDLDQILGGGFPRGAYVLLEVSNDVAIAEIRLLTTGLMLNFITQGRGVMVIPMQGVSSKELRNILVSYTSSQSFDNLVRISEQTELEEPGSVPPYVLPIRYGEGSGRESDLSRNSDAFYSAYKKLKSKTGSQPILRCVAYDNLESSYARFSERLLNEMGLAMVRTRAAGDVTVSIARPTVSVLTKMTGMVDWHLKLWKKDEVLLVQGVKPHTNIYSADCDISKGYPVMTLKLLA